MMKAILIDDEQLALDLLERNLNNIGSIEVIGTHTDPMEGKKDILQQDVDLIFLDIHLPEVNGMELAEQIIEKKPYLPIIFVTAFNEYAVKAFELNALDYIVKPIQLDRLRKTVARLPKNPEVKKKQRESDEEVLAINVCNELKVKTEKGEFESIAWRTTRARELFLYLLQYHNRLVRKSTLLELLWPDFDEERAYTQLYSTVYLVRKTVESYKSHLEIKNVAEGYILKTNKIHIDIVEWERRIKQLPAVTKRNITDYIEYMNLYTGPYLEMYDYWWAESEKYRYEEIWLTIALKIARFYDKNNDLRKAVKWYEDIYKQRPEIEESTLYLMKIHAETGNNTRVYELYEQLLDVLDELDTPPGREIRQWYQSWDKKMLS